MFTIAIVMTSIWLTKLLLVYTLHCLLTYYVFLPKLVLSLSNQHQTIFTNLRCMATCYCNCAYLQNFWFIRPQRAWRYKRQEGQVQEVTLNIVSFYSFISFYESYAVVCIVFMEWVSPLCCEWLSAWLQRLNMRPQKTYHACHMAELMLLHCNKYNNK